MSRTGKVILYVGIFACMTFFLTSCQTISDDAKQWIDKPVDCKTAADDIEILEGEKAAVHKRVITGATSVTPAGAALTILTGQAGDKASVVSGDYNQKIDNKIAEIRRVCGAQGAYE